MGRIIAITNQKGGAGKSTTALYLAMLLTRMRRSVLLVDLDLQSNSTSGSGLVIADQESLLERALLSDFVLEMTDIPHSPMGYQVLSAGLQTAKLERLLMVRLASEFQLRRLLESLRADFDYIFIDCPPSWGLLTLNALVAADGILLPIPCRNPALAGIGSLLNNLKTLARELNPSLVIDGVVRTFFDARSAASVEAAAEIERLFGKKVFRTLIPEHPSLLIALSQNEQTLPLDSLGSKSYLALVSEWCFSQRVQR